MRTEEIKLRDPFILAHQGIYYIYGSVAAECGQKSFFVRSSTDLENWSEPKEVFKADGYFEDAKDFWAPEVYYYNGKFYMFASMQKENELRGTYIFSSDTPDGWFTLHSDGPASPKEWQCLDGTLYFENGKLYMVFCHEWIQVRDGEICAIELSADLKKYVGDPFVLFKASEAGWTKKIGDDIYVTDGPFVFKEDGILYMLWSGSCKTGYCVALSYSESGTLNGEWKHDHPLLFSKDGGHAMLFNDFNDNKKLVLHAPNTYTESSPVIFDFCKEGKSKYLLKIKDNII